MTLALVVGCSWEGSNNTDFTAWNDSYNWINFSGTYRSTAGGVLVADFNGTPGSASSTVTSSETTLGTSIGGQHTYAGTLANTPVSPGTMTIDCAGFHFSDDGSGTLAGSIAGTSGSINYSTGNWTLNLGGLDFGDGNRIAVNYRYVEGTSTGSADPGSTGVTIYSMVVAQTGNALVFRDSAGGQYTGYISGVSTAGGNPQEQTTAGGNTTASTGTENVTPQGQNSTASGSSTTIDGQGSSTQTERPQGRVYGDAICQFEVQGTSSAGVGVTITGTLNLTYTSDTTTTRTMNATWIEDSGATGDISATAS